MLDGKEKGETQEKRENGEILDKGQLL